MHANSILSGCLHALEGFMAVKVSLLAGHARLQDWRAGNTVKGKYSYMQDLLSLEATRLCRPPALPAELCRIVLPLHLDRWAEFMDRHPDRRFTHYISDGIRQGFHIGFTRISHQCVLAKRNMKSASQFPQVISDYLKKECS